MHDLVEWAAKQSCSNGNVGVVGSDFAATQVEAAVERRPHLNAIMPIAGAFDLYESATHYGPKSRGFITPFLFALSPPNLRHHSRGWSLARLNRGAFDIDPLRNPDQVLRSGIAVQHPVLRS